MEQAVTAYPIFNRFQNLLPIDSLLCHTAVRLVTREWAYYVFQKKPPWTSI